MFCTNAGLTFYVDSAMLAIHVCYVDRITQSQENDLEFNTTASRMQPSLQKLSKSYKGQNHA